MPRVPTTSVLDAVLAEDALERKARRLGERRVLRFEDAPRDPPVAALDQGVDGREERERRVLAA